MIVKVCGLTRIEDAEAAIEAGADVLGVVREPSSPRFVPDDHELLAWLRDSQHPVRAVFGPYRLENSLPPPFGVQSFAPGPGGRFWQVIRVRGEFDAQQVDALADTLVLDAHRPDALGGTGHRVDVDWARSWIQGHSGPTILAGGLNPDNVAEAIHSLEPWGVDASSGLEARPGVKDHGKVKDFVAAVRELEKKLRGH